MPLIYLSPVSWNSFPQRPHRFVEWFHATFGEQVLWVDPYPTRLPTLDDFRRSGMNDKGQNDTDCQWIKVLKPKSLPIEPLPGAHLINHWFWRDIVQKIVSVSSDGKMVLCIGKPSKMAIQLLGFNYSLSMYDAMDDFPAFYSGYSQKAMKKNEEYIVDSVSLVTTSSTVLFEKWSAVKKGVQLIKNGLELESLPAYQEKKREARIVFGYVGTIGKWFDWDLIRQLATSRPCDVVRLIGPVYTPASFSLPENVELLPPCDHKEAMANMAELDVGLIPFIHNTLTHSVDPIKYYEYRGLGLPVISTDFGEMTYRKKQPGTFVIDQSADLQENVDSALSYKPRMDEIVQFRTENAWDTRFDEIHLPA